MLNSQIVRATLLCLACSSAVFAQAAPANPVSDAIRQSWAEARRNISESATVMADADFAFKPVDSVRTFGAILAHVAGASYEFCAAAKNVAPPHREDEFEKTAKTAAEIRKAVTESLAYCDSAYSALTDRSAAEMANAAFGSGKAPRAAALIGNASHLMEHYGNLVTYFRIKGIVPPSSRRQ
ncbi:MAG: DinB family protein [Vicinamibacterales bacterium]